MINLIALAIFILSISMVAFFSLLGKIHLSLLFTIPLFPLQNILERFHQFQYGNHFINIVIITMMIGWVFGSILKNKRIFEPTPFNKILFIMFIYTYISLWIGSSFLGFPAPISASDIRVQTWKNYMILPLIFFITINNIRTLKQIKWLIVAMVFSMFIMDRYTGNQIKWMPGLVSRAKIHGTFAWLGPNEVAAFYTTYTFVLLGILLFDRVKIRRILFTVAVILNTYCALFLYSRGAYVAILIGLIFISLLKKRILVIPLIALFIFWQSILPVKVVERINETKTEEGTLDNSSQLRLEMWKECFNLFEKNPIVGSGFNTIPYLGFTLGDTHNIYVKVLTEQGIIGMVIFLILFILSLKTSWRLYKTANDLFLKGLGLGFTVCIIAMMVVNFFGDRWTYLQLGAYYWVFLALVVRGNIIVQQQNKS